MDGDGAITVDGGAGEGGGQILRTALSCAAVLRRCVRITAIRAGRPKPGLQRQHLACVEALRGVCPGSVVEGAVLGSSQLTFDARGASIAGGDHVYDIGSAGSTTLVLQTVLPALLFAPAPSSMTVGGGTHNPMAPPFDFLRDSLAPVLAAAGVRVEFELLRHGFYPAGGGKVVARVTPFAVSAPQTLALLQRGPLVARHADVLYANLPPDVARREAAEFRRLTGWSADVGVRVAETAVQASGPGNVVLATAAYAAAPGATVGVTEVVAAFGERGKRAELVAADAAAAIQRYTGCSAAAPVSEHLSDQLLLPLALGCGGSFGMAGVSSHFSTNADVLRQFLGPRAVTYTQAGPGVWVVVVEGLRQEVGTEAGAGVGALGGAATAAGREGSAAGGLAGAAHTNGGAAEAAGGAGELVAVAGGAVVPAEAAGGAASEAART